MKTPNMTWRLRPLLLPALFTLLVGAILVALGIWQLHRLSWKEAIIARIEARTTAAAVSLPPRADWSTLAPTDYEYRRVTLKGTFDKGKEAAVFRGSEDGAGYLVMVPLALEGGGTVLVDRGWVPADLKDPAMRKAGEPTGPVTVTGLMRGPEPRNLFTPADEPDKGTFFTRDPVGIARHLDLIDAAPFTVDADATPNPGGWPRGGATQVAIPNNHFSYAMTWFGLALGLFGVFGSFAWKRLATDQPHETDADPLRSPG